MNYKNLTIYNFAVSYYLIRLFTIFWIGRQISVYVKFSQRPQEFYEHTVWMQKLLMREYPSPEIYFSVIFITVALLIYSLFKFSIWVNILLFLLTAYITLASVGYIGLGHNNHVLVLTYFFSIFLNHKKMKTEDYRAVEIFYLGILITYSLAGLWKLVSVTKNFITENPEISWFERDAAKYNSMLNYFIIDQKMPIWMLEFYQYKELWIFLTIFGIICQTSCFLGAFNRKILNLVLIFLVSFHLYTAYFVIADWGIMKYGLIVLFFPYHHFSKWIDRIFKI